MIKPANATPLNMSNKLVYQCKFCGEKGKMFLENPIDTKNNGTALQPLKDYTCPKCGKDLTP